MYACPLLLYEHSVFYTVRFESVRFRGCTMKEEHKRSNKNTIGLRCLFNHDDATKQLPFDSCGSVLFVVQIVLTFPSKMSFQIANQIIGGQRIFVIAEIGQNHQGDIEIAKRMIADAKAAGADCVKFQKSCLNEKFTKNALTRTYDGPNSWGRTYGEHKEYLEFSIEQYKLLQAFANEQNIIFTASAMDIQSLQDLEDLNVPVIKIGSGDANNIPLLEKAATFQTPLIISTGMQDERMVQRIVEIMHTNGKKNYCLLHCVSAYPTLPQHVNLRLLCTYRESFPDICLGYSGHEQGIAISTAAVLFGAKVNLVCNRVELT